MLVWEQFRSDEAAFGPNFHQDCIEFTRETEAAACNSPQDSQPQNKIRRRDSSQSLTKNRANDGGGERAFASGSPMDCRAIEAAKSFSPSETEDRFADATQDADTLGQRVSTVA